MSLVAQDLGIVAHDLHRAVDEVFFNSVEGLKKFAKGKNTNELKALHYDHDFNSLLTLLRYIDERVRMLNEEDPKRSRFVQAKEEVMTIVNKSGLTGRLTQAINIPRK